MVLTFRNTVNFSFFITLGNMGSADSPYFTLLQLKIVPSQINSRKKHKSYSYCQKKKHAVHKMYCNQASLFSKHPLRKSYKLEKKKLFSDIFHKTESIFQTENLPLIMEGQTSNSLNKWMNAAKIKRDKDKYILEFNSKFTCQTQGIFSVKCVDAQTAIAWIWVKPVSIHK